MPLERCGQEQIKFLIIFIPTYQEVIEGLFLTISLNIFLFIDKFEKKKVSIDDICTPPQNHQKCG